MRKVLLVDDEEVIIDGLRVLIDWQGEGFQVFAAASGREALDFLRRHRVDLVILDIRMPDMTGLELMEAVRAEDLSCAGFVVLSGYSEFEYARQALHLGCLDYLVKPVDERELLNVLRRFSNSAAQPAQSSCEQALLAHHMASLLHGSRDESDLRYATEHLELAGPMRYVEFEFVTVADVDQDEEQSDEAWCRLYHACQELLGEDGRCAYYADTGGADSCVGFLLSEPAMRRRQETERDYLRWAARSLCAALGREVHILAGKRVPSLAQIARSYETAGLLRTLVHFRQEDSVYFYENELRERQERQPICKAALDALVTAVQQNDPKEIEAGVNWLFQEMRQRGMTGKDVNVNVHYLLFRLTELAARLDRETEQEEIIRYLSDTSSDSRIRKGSRQHLQRFALEFAEYLSQLARTQSVDIVARIEREVREHYAENLTLSELGRKYYINSSYLGQIFRKQHKMSFKSYLTSYRIEQAAQQLLRTKKSISQIALDTGYRDTGYFIRKFIEAKGCTPSRYRKNRGVVQDEDLNRKP